MKRTLLTIALLLSAFTVIHAEDGVIGTGNDFAPPPVTQPASSSLIDDLLALIDWP